MTHWVLGEFAEPGALLAALETLRGEHVRELDAHSPRPVPGVDAALGIPRAGPAWAAFFSAGMGAVIGLAGQRWLAEVNPFAYVPLTFLTALLCAALGIGVRLWRLSRRDHAVFRHEPFVKSASSSGYWVSVNTRVPEDAERAKSRLEALGAKNVAIVQEPER